MYVVMFQKLEALLNEDYLEVRPCEFILKDTVEALVSWHAPSGCKKGVRYMDPAAYETHGSRKRSLEV